MAVERAAGQLRAALTHLGMNLSTPDFADTPWRAARLWAELLAGHAEAAPPITPLERGVAPAGLVTLYDLPFHALCAHHLLPFFGRAHLAYWPGDRIAGLGDLARVVRHFSRRLTFQERLALDVARHLERELAPRGVGVVLEGRHLCLEMRGAERRARFETATYHGVLEDPVVRGEFLRGLRSRRPGPVAAGGEARDRPRPPRPTGEAAEARARRKRPEKPGGRRPASRKRSSPSAEAPRGRRSR